jgi:xylulokinase
LRKSLIWQDRRAVEEAEWLQKRFSLDDRIRYLGVDLPLDSTTIPARVLWLKEHEPQIFNEAIVILQPKDFLTFKLTGKLATDVISCKTIINFSTNAYEPEYLKAAGIPMHIFPEPHQPQDVIGETICFPQIGLPAGIPVVAGTIDAWANILGSGVTKPGLASETAGTSEVLSVVGEHIVTTNRFNVIPSFDHVIYNGPMQAGGGALNWFANIVLDEDKIQDERSIINKWSSQLEEVPCGSEGLIFLPYLQGERTPIWDSRARGVFIGLNFSHTQSHLARAIMEGVSCNVRHVAETIEEIGGISITAIHISGGAAKSRLWNQIKADMLGRQITQVVELETCNLGAALLAGIGVGLFTDYTTAAENSVRYGEIYYPNPQRHSTYQEVFAVYKDIYPLLKDVFPRLSWKQLEETDLNNHMEEQRYE